MKKTIITVILISICIFALILWSNYRTNQCRKNNGKVVLDYYGLFDKCIME